jgi:hypothetical protein
MRLKLFRNQQGEPRIWTFGINESAKKRPRSFPFHYRWFLHGPSWCFNVEWCIRRRSKAMLLFSIGEGDGPQISMWMAIPFILSLYLTLEWPDLEPIVPTVRTKSYRGGYWNMPITRSVGFRIFDGQIWVDLWADPNNSANNATWQEFSWGPANFFLGRVKYSRRNQKVFETEIIMPEGRYPATVTTYIGQWKRPRWPAKRIYKAEIEVPGGIPIPGKGENSWDIDDTTIDSMTCTARTINEASQKMFDTVMRDRIRHAAADWQPDEGWPEHIKQGV